MAVKTGERTGVYEWLVATLAADHAVTEPEPPHLSYLLVLIDPDHAERLEYTRDDVGLRLYIDGLFDSEIDSVYDARKIIGAECGYPVEPVEHHEDGLWYWTFRPTPTGA